MKSPALAASIADWIDPYGAARVPEPVPVGETKISLALAPARKARTTAGVSLIINMMTEDQWSVLKNNIF
jgi:hypothetical protein